MNNLRKRILEVAYRDGMGHIPSALSIVDIIETIYDIKTDDDVFILSKGHGCMALYAVLESKGLLSWETKLQGHPKRGGAITASTGSLGHGLPMAVGMALAKKIKGERGRIFVLVGDGECNEGTTWESAMVASHHKLDNLVVIVDQNHSSDRALNTGDIVQKFCSFNWDSTHLYYGHHKGGLKYMLDFGDKEFDGYDNENPICVVVHTIKGKGVPFMETDHSWHNRKLTKEDYEKAIS